MNGSISVKAIDRTNYTELTKTRLDKITEIEIIFTKRLVKENHAVKN